MSEIDSFIYQMKEKWKVKPVMGSRDYWRYRADQNKFIQMTNQVKKIEAGETLLVEDLLHEQVEDMFK